MADQKIKKLVDFAKEAFKGVMGGAALASVMEIVKAGATKLGDEISPMDIKKVRIMISGHLEQDDENLYGAALARVRKNNYAHGTKAEERLAQLTHRKADLARLSMLGAPYVGDIDNQQAKKAHEEARIANCMEQIVMIAEFNEAEWENHKTIMYGNETRLEDRFNGLVGIIRTENQKIASSDAVNALNEATKDNWTEIRNNFGI